MLSSWFSILFGSTSGLRREQEAAAPALLFLYGARTLRLSFGFSGVATGSHCQRAFSGARVARSGFREAPSASARARRPPRRGKRVGGRGRGGRRWPGCGTSSHSSRSRYGSAAMSIAGRKKPEFLDVWRPGRAVGEYFFRSKAVPIVFGHGKLTASVPEASAIRPRRRRFLHEPTNRPLLILQDFAPFLFRARVSRRVIASSDASVERASGP